MNPSVKREKKSIWVLQRFSSNIEKFTIISYSFTVSKSSHKKAVLPSIFFPCICEMNRAVKVSMSCFFFPFQTILRFISHELKLSGSILAEFFSRGYSSSMRALYLQVNSLTLLFSSLHRESVWTRLSNCECQLSGDLAFDRPRTNQHTGHGHWRAAHLSEHKLMFVTAQASCFVNQPASILGLQTYC